MSSSASSQRYRGSDPGWLLAAASAGDQQAWHALVDRFDPLIRSVLAGYRLDRESAADVGQTVWLRVFEHQNRIRHPERLGAWIAATARHEALRSIKRLQRNAPSDELDETPDLNAPSPDERAIDAEILRDALSAFRQLPEDSKSLLRLLVASPPLPYAEIAAEVGRPVGSIGPSRSRCLRALRANMNDPGPAVAA
jgi:RNA polymerase sigma factor (sigma-70 family)